MKLPAVLIARAVPFNGTTTDLTRTNSAFRFHAVEGSNAD